MNCNNADVPAEYIFLNMTKTFKNIIQEKVPNAKPIVEARHKNCSNQKIYQVGRESKPDLK